MSFVTSKRAAAQQVDTRNDGAKPQSFQSNVVAMSNSQVLTRRKVRHELPNKDSLSNGHHEPRGGSARVRAHQPMGIMRHRATTNHRELMEMALVGDKGEVYTSDTNTLSQLSDITAVPGLQVWLALVLIFVAALVGKRLYKTKHANDDVLPTH